MTILFCIPFYGVMIGFIYKLGIGSQSVNNLEEQISMIAHILTAGNLGVIVILIHRIGA